MKTAEQMNEIENADNREHESRRAGEQKKNSNNRMVDEHMIDACCVAGHIHCAMGARLWRPCWSLVAACGPLRLCLDLHFQCLTCEFTLQLAPTELQPVQAGDDLRGGTWRCRRDEPVPQREAPSVEQLGGVAWW